MALLCLWGPWSCGVPGLHVWSPVSGPVCVLSQSAIVTLLSLLWVGLLLALVRGPCLRLTLWDSACVDPHGCPDFSRVGPAPSAWVPLLWTWLRGRLPPCSFSSVFLRDVVTFWGQWCLRSLLIANEGFHWSCFLLRCSLPFRSAVVVFLRPLWVCHGS